MATTFKLKRKTFALLSDGSGKSLSQFKAEYDKAGGAKGTGKSFKEWYRGGSPSTVEVGGSAISRGATGSAIANTNNQLAQTTATRQVNRAANKANAAGVKEAAMKARTAGYNKGLMAGRNSVGIKQAAMNSWNRMGKMGKAGTLAAGAVGVGLMAKGLFGGKKKDN